VFGVRVRLTFQFLERPNRAAQLADAKSPVDNSMALVTSVYHKLQVSVRLNVQGLDMTADLRAGL